MATYHLQDSAPLWYPNAAFVFLVAFNLRSNLYAFLHMEAAIESIGKKCHIGDVVAMLAKRRRETPDAISVEENRAN